MLSCEEIRILLEALEAVYGKDYPEVRPLAQLYAKLSLMAADAAEKETHEHRAPA